MRPLPSPHPSPPLWPAAAQQSDISDESRWLGPSWGVTMPASFEPAPQSEPFEEALHGLAVREVREPEIFRLFFGRKVRAY